MLFWLVVPCIRTHPVTVTLQLKINFPRTGSVGFEQLWFCTPFHLQTCCASTSAASVLTCVTADLFWNCCCKALNERGIVLKGCEFRKRYMTEAARVTTQYWSVAGLLLHGVDQHFIINHQINLVWRIRLSFTCQRLALAGVVVMVCWWMIALCDWGVDFDQSEYWTWWMSTGNADLGKIGCWRWAAFVCWEVNRTRVAANGELSTRLGFRIDLDRWLDVHSA